MSFSKSPTKFFGDMTNTSSTEQNITIPQKISQNVTPKLAGILFQMQGGNSQVVDGINSEEDTQFQNKRIGVRQVHMRQASLKKQ